jgi:hypothetical protein
MRSGTVHLYDADEVQPRPAGPIEGACAPFLLLLGAMLSRAGAICSGVGRRWLGEQHTRAWAKALDYFRGVAPAAEGLQNEGRQPGPAWECGLVRVGSSIVLGVIGALAALWTFLLIGGALAWLATHGYGFYLLLGTVALGGGVGVALARREPHSAQQDNLN